MSCAVYLSSSSLKYSGSTSNQNWYSKFQPQQKSTLASIKCLYLPSTSYRRSSSPSSQPINITTNYRPTPPISEISEGTMMNSPGQGDHQTVHQRARSKESPLYENSPRPDSHVPATSNKDHSARCSTEQEIAEIELPIWLPERIKVIVRNFLLGRCLKFEVLIFKFPPHSRSNDYQQLDSLTEYRGALEITRRHKWNDYIKAATAKKRQHRALHRIRRVSISKPHVKYRVTLYKIEKMRAAEAVKKLADIQHGVMILDEAINEACAREVEKYAKQFAWKISGWRTL